MRRIAVCSWSLRPTGPEDLVNKLKACGANAVQLALDPIREGSWDERETKDRLANAGIEIASGMMGMAGEDYSTLESIKSTGGVRLDEKWPTNHTAAEMNAAIARRLGITLVTFHAGFLPHDPADPERRVMIERLRQIVDAFAAKGVQVAFETGQESAETLLSVLDELARPSVGVNFDPANMILYGMGEPVAALRALLRHVKQIHIKDARATRTPGTWGDEVTAGTGEVNWAAFISLARRELPNVHLCIEREAGESRVEDIRAARELLRSHIEGVAPAPIVAARRTIGVGVIGLGFMGRTHIGAYVAAAAAGYGCELVAVADPDRSRLSGDAPAGGNLGGSAQAKLFDPAKVKGYADASELLADPRVELVSICTYTDTHVDLATRALAAGKHVLVEKPVAIAPADVQRLAAAAERAGTLCMPAMCMRFWPGWDWLHDRVRDGRYGKVRSATFQRLGSGPNWSAGFYQDATRSGGALVDLHIHDADFVYWCFGKPSRVSSAGSLSHVLTQYHYTDGVCVAAEGAWDLAPSAGFRMKFLVNFERASAEFDLAKSPTLTLHTADKSEAITLPPTNGYDGEVRHLLEAISSGSRELRATLKDAVAVAELLELERSGLRG
jgi:L-ribulose-5-phosphate 3-epimerase